MVNTSLSYGNCRHADLLVFSVLHSIEILLDHFWLVNASSISRSLRSLPRVRCCFYHHWRHRTRPSTPRISFLASPSTLHPSFFSVRTSIRYLAHCLLLVRQRWGQRVLRRKIRGGPSLTLSKWLRSISRFERVSDQSGLCSSSSRIGTRMRVM